MTQHAKAAHQLLDSLPLDVDVALSAIALATLELAEQQRAANLIAYEALHLGGPDVDGRRGILAVPRSEVSDEIDRLLGLNDGDES